MNGLNIHQYREKYPDVSKQYPDDVSLTTAVYRSKLNKEKILPENMPYAQFKEEFLGSPNIKQDENIYPLNKWVRSPGAIDRTVYSDKYKVIGGTAEGFTKKVAIDTGRMLSDIGRYPYKKIRGHFDPEWEKRYESDREALREVDDLLISDAFAVGKEDLLSIEGIPRATLKLAKEQIASGEYNGTLKDFLYDPEGIKTSGSYPHLRNTLRLNSLPDNYKKAILSGVLEENETELSNFDVELVRPESTSGKVGRVLGGDLAPFIVELLGTKAGAVKLLRSPQHLKRWDDILTKKLDDLAYKKGDKYATQVKNSLKRTGLSGVQQAPSLTIAGEFTSQALLNPYEQTLATTLSKMSVTDDTFAESLVEFLAVDKEDSELTARLKMALENLIIYPVALGLEAGIKASGISAMAVLKGMKSGKDKVLNNQKVIEFMHKYGIEYSRGARELYDDTGKIVKDTTADVKRLLSTNSYYRKLFTGPLGLLSVFRQGAQSKRMATAGLEAEGKRQSWTFGMSSIIDMLDKNIRNITKFAALEGKNRLLKQPIIIGEKGVKGTFKWEGGDITNRDQLLDFVQTILTSDYRTFGIKTSQAYKTPITQAKGFNEMLEVLPKEIAGDVRRGRELIDELSMKVLDSELINPEIKKIIQDNLGIYLTRSYRFFTDASWQPSKDVIEDFVKYLSTPIKKGNGKWTPATYNEYEARRVLNDMLTSRAGIKQEGLDEGFETYVKLISQLNKGVFKDRKNIVPEMKAFLGEFEDPMINLYHTTSKLAHYVELDNYLKTIKEVGEDVYFLTAKQVEELWKTNPKKAEMFVQLEGKYLGKEFRTQKPLLGFEEGKKETIPMFGKLEGYYTTPEIKKVIQKVAGYKKQWFDRGDIIAKIFTGWAGVKSLGNMNATVLNNITHERNFMSGPIFLLSNGAMPNGKAFQIATSSIMNDLSKTHKGNWDEYTKKLIEHRLANSSVLGEQIQRVFKRYQTGPRFTGNLRHRISNSINNTKYGKSITDNIKKVAAPIRAAKNVYVAEDTFWKSVYWEHTKNQLRRAYPDMIEEGIERKAAAIVRDTMPNYNMLSPILETFQYLPFGSFFAFRAEEIRTAVNMFTYGAREIVSDNPHIRQMGVRRLAGATAVAGPLGLGTSAISEISKKINGIGDDIELAIHELLPDYAKSGEYTYYTDENGDIHLSNIAYNDPYYDIHKELVRYSMQRAAGEIQGKEFNEKTTELVVGAITRLFNPFVQESISSQAITEVLITGRDQYGRDIFDLSEDFDTDTPLWMQSNNLWRAMSHFGTAVLKPKVITNIQRIIDAKEYQYDEMEFKYDYESEVFANAFGVRYTKFDPKISFGRRIRYLNMATQKATSNFNTIAREAGVSADNVINAREKFLNTKYIHDSEKAVAVDSMFTLGYNRKDIDTMLKDSGISEKNRIALLNNQFRVTPLSNNQIKNILKNNEQFRERSKSVEGPYLSQELAERLDKVNESFITGNRKLVKLYHNDPKRKEAYRNNVLNLYPLPEAWEDFKREDQKKLRKGKIVK